MTERSREEWDRLGALSSFVGGYMHGNGDRLKAIERRLEEIERWLARLERQQQHHRGERNDV